MDYVSSLTSKGQVTIPVTIRKALGLKPRDKVAFHMENGAVRIEAAESIVQARYGIAKLSKPFRDLKQLRRDMEEEVADEVLREMSS